MSRDNVDGIQTVVAGLSHMETRTRSPKSILATMQPVLHRLPVAVKGTAIDD